MDQSDLEGITLDGTTLDKIIREGTTGDGSE